MVGFPASHNHDLEELVMILRVIADPARIAILRLLGQGERNVTAIHTVTGLPQSTASHHLAQMRMLRLVSARRDGKQVVYSLGERFTIEEMGRLVLDMPGASVCLEPTEELAAVA